MLLGPAAMARRSAAETAREAVVSQHPRQKGVNCGVDLLPNGRVLQ